MYITINWVNLCFPLHEQIPNWFEGECSGSTKDNPFPLPEAYVKSQQKNVSLKSHFSCQQFKILDCKLDLACSNLLVVLIYK